jgi:hypothetical protein
MMCVFTAVNLIITKIAPDAAIAEAAVSELDKRKEYPLKEDQVLYAEVLNKIKSCSVQKDKEDNEFYTCPDGSTISIVHWTRSGGDRKGVVTKYYNKDGKHILQYGHPDDVY